MIEFAFIWFFSNSCSLCGCNTLNAVAGGPNGCGCVIGCYEKAIEWRKERKSCPICNHPLDEIIKIFIQADIS